MVMKAKLLVAAIVTMFATVLVPMTVRASDGTGGGASGEMGLVMSAITTLTTLIGNIFTLMTSNPVLAIFLAAGLLGVAIVVFKRLRGAAR
ncbi:MAG: hypothetical protein FWD90_12280 [Defluviitaleaceae bacterium]|nr:hypothetical protein [Defluviitaleaceae bacterium]